VARTLLTWRWAGFTLLLVAAVVAMVLLGRWQWQRSVPEAAVAATDLSQVEPGDLPEVTTVAREAGDGALVPEGASGELVRVAGTWRSDRTLLVADRDLDDRPGRWLLTAVELSDGGLVPVVRGWLPDDVGGPDEVEAVAGPVELAGWVQQSEPLDIPVEVVQPDGVVALLSTADLANRWPEDLVPGFVVLAPTPDQVRDAERTGLTVLPTPPTEETESRDWRNLAYSAQWFVFAGFAVLLWWRMLRDDAARRRTHETSRDVSGRPTERSTT
jgi:surfeit locus 1 family protein